MSIIYYVSKIKFQIKNLIKKFNLVQIMNFILVFPGYLYLYPLIVGLKLNGQQKVKEYVREKDLFIYVY